MSVRSDEGKKPAGRVVKCHLVPLLVALMWLVEVAETATVLHAALEVEVERIRVVEAWFESPLPGSDEVSWLDDALGLG